MILGLKKLATAGTAALCLLFNTASAGAAIDQEMQPVPVKSASQVKSIFNNSARATLADKMNNAKALDAINKYQSAVDGSSACLGLATDRLLDDVANGNLPQPDAAREIIESLTTQELLTLPMKTKINLIKALIADGKPDGKNLNALIRLYHNTGEDAVFSAWDSQKQGELAQKLKDDPELIQARSNWHRMNDAQKIKVLQHVSDLAVEVYGKDTGMSRRQVTANNLGQYTYGQYNSLTNIISINMNVGAVSGSFDMSVGVTLHETMHAFHDHLDGLELWGSLDKNDPAYLFARLIYHSFTYGGYITSDTNYWGYRVNPTERHAQELEDLAIYTGKGQGATVPAFVALRGANIKKNFDQDRNDAINKARQSNSGCRSYFSP